MNNLNALIILVAAFLIFLIVFPIIFIFKRKANKKEMIMDILISKPSSNIYNSLRHLGQEDFTSWIWDERKVKELSYKELIKINMLVLEYNKPIN